MDMRRKSCSTVPIGVCRYICTHIYSVLWSQVTKMFVGCGCQKTRIRCLAVLWWSKYLKELIINIDNLRVGQHHFICSNRDVMTHTSYHHHSQSTHTQLQVRIFMFALYNGSIYRALPFYGIRWRFSDVELTNYLKKIFVKTKR